MKEPMLAPILRFMRLRRVIPVVRKMYHPKLLDIGCGWDAKFLENVEPYIHEAVGIDFKAPNLNTDKIKTFKATISNELPFEDARFDVVTMIAVLEHMSYPLAIAKEVNRVLIGGGLLILTVPSRLSKPVLEFLAKLSIVNPIEIRDHKKYYDKKDILELFVRYGFEIQKHQYFQFGMNNFCVLKKIY